MTVIDVNIDTLTVGLNTKQQFREFQRGFDGFFD